MRITILIDNRVAGGKCELVAEHGFCALIETDVFFGQRVLLDMGASGRFAENAERMGVDAFGVDFAVISHGHIDHCGGLGTFLEGSEAKVYLSSEILHSEMFSLRGGSRHDIGADLALIQQNIKRFCAIEGSQWIAPNVALIRNSSHNFNVPFGNSFQRIVRDGVESSDEYSHELALVVVEGDGMVILSPCSHSGVGNIIESAMHFCGTQPLKAFLGGFHIVESESCGTEVDYFLSSIKELYPATKFYTGHCTCESAIEKLRGNISVFSTGYSIEI